MTMVTLNGSRQEIADGTTLDQLVALFSLPEHGVALAMNREVVPRSAWPSTPVLPDAQVEVVSAAKGG
jgi:sulfur carrier protein